ncbi:threonine--tRNA ligase [Candidatus Nomurabacteria bacterium]|nr:threonine--tRNA ligase [Candidatus Nomurabacteria bacterium]
MDKLHNLRHSLAHLLAASVGEIYKFDKVKLTLGPAIDNGFYYDIDFGDEKVSDADLKKIEDRMKKILPKWTDWEHKEISKDEALNFFKNEYKQELINEIAERGEKITTYTCGGFTDLCRGGHLKNPAKEIDPESFKLDRVAGAYWRGDEKNKMLTRIYGLAFETKEQLDAYLSQREEAEKRDHRKLGKELEIFTFSEEVGMGLPLWLPNGTVIRQELEKWAKETEIKWGYKHISTPHITKKDLFEISGHLPYYKDDLYSPIDIEGEEYYLKPMNCPFAHMIYKSKPRSYRDLTLRLAEYGQVYRFERSGTLHGLMRARGFCQNDAHIYVKPEDAISELLSVFKMHEYYYKNLGILDWWVVFGVRDPNNLRSKYHGDDAMWDEAEKLTKEALDKVGVKYVVEEGGAAHYGPKADIYIKSVIGKEYAIGTVQLDLYMPKRFDLEYTSKDGSKKMPYVIHRAPLGSHERMIGFLLEHFAGAFPLWLSPVQVKVIPVRTSHNEYARKIFETLTANNIRAELDDKDENLGAKVRDAKNNKIPYWLVIGDKEIEAGKVTLESRDHGQIGQISPEELLGKLLGEIKNKI